MNKKSFLALPLVYSLAGALALIWLRPFGLDLRQSLLLAGLVLTLIWWTTGIVHKSAASLFLLLFFFAVGHSTWQTLLKFPLSPNFFVIGASFLLSQGIVNARAADRLSQVLLGRYVKKPLHLIGMSFLLGLLMVFMIPQPFSRVILIASLYLRFLEGIPLAPRAREALLFSVFAASTTTSMVFLNGDVILNYAALQFGGLESSWTQWARLMALPSLVVSLLVGLGLFLLFRRDFQGIAFTAGAEAATDQAEKPGQTAGKERMALGIMGGVIVLWMTEPWHGIGGGWIGGLGVALMALAGLLSVKDLKSLNVHLLLFLTAAFSIGGVLQESGVAGQLYTAMVQYFPKDFSLLYVVVVALLIMGLHMVLGSSLTTLSVAIPGLLQLTQGRMDPLSVVLIAYLVVNLHFLLPFHHVTVMIGAGEGYYANRTVLRYGLMMTGLIWPILLGIYLPWWRLMGLL